MNIKEILEKHSLYLKNLEGGECANLAGANLTNAKLKGANLAGAKLKGANFTCANLAGVNLAGAKLKGANLAGADLTGAILTCATLTDAIIPHADLTNATITYANLIGVDLYDAILLDANLAHSDLTYASLVRADLIGADLTKVRLTRCIGDGRRIKNINIRHEFPIAYTRDRVQIGCQNHSIEMWLKFSGKEIASMGGVKALSLWKKYKDLVFGLIKESPAE